jgi:hypothetical protein
MAMAKLYLQSYQLPRKAVTARTFPKKLCYTTMKQCLVFLCLESKVKLREFSISFILFILSVFLSLLPYFRQ